MGPDIPWIPDGCGRAGSPLSASWATVNGAPRA